MAMLKQKNSESCSSYQTNQRPHYFLVCPTLAIQNCFPTGSSISVPPKVSSSLWLVRIDDDPDESSEAIFKQIVTIPESNGLSINQISAYGADNASVNYGWHNSVFQKLRAANPLIVKGNCECHILNNTVRSLIEVTDSCSKGKHKI